MSRRPAISFKGFMGSLQTRARREVAVGCSKKP